MGTPATRVRGYSLDALLHELGSDAIDTLLRELGLDGVKALRAACKGVRDVVDGNVQTISISVQPNHWLQFQEPLVFLPKWPRCNTITATLHADGGTEADNADLLSHLLARIFVTQPRNARERITRLELRRLGFSVLPIPGPALLSVALLLPALREIHLHGLNYLGGPLHQQLVFGALSTLPHLGALSLPGCGCLAQVSGLADRLRRLSIVSNIITGGVPLPLTVVEVAALSRLTQLQELVMVQQPLDPDAWGVLLNCLPPSVRTVELRDGVLMLTGEAVCIRLALHRGVLTECGIAPGFPEVSPCLSMRALVMVAGWLLLPCRALGPRLPVLHVSTLEAVGAVDLAPLRTLVRRCDRVHLEALSLGGHVSRDTALQAVDLLGTPDRVRLVVGSLVQLYSLGAGAQQQQRRNTRGDEPSAAAGTAAPAAAEQQQQQGAAAGAVTPVVGLGMVAERDPRPASVPLPALPPAPAPEAVLGMALRLLADAGLVHADRVGEGNAGSAATPLGELLLLRGPLIRDLLRQPDPALTTRLVRLLRPTHPVAAAAGAPRQTLWDGLWRLQALPGADAVRGWSATPPRRCGRRWLRRWQRRRPGVLRRPPPLPPPRALLAAVWRPACWRLWQGRSTSRRGAAGCCCSVWCCRQSSGSYRRCGIRPLPPPARSSTT